MKTIHDYAIGILASHNVIKFLKVLLNSLRRFAVNPGNIYIGDAGLLEDEIKDLLNKRKVHVIDLPKKNKGTFRTQSPKYKTIIDNRVEFLKTIKATNQKGAILQLDADTAIASEQFPDVDPNAEIVLTVRKDTSYILKFRKYKDAYPNLGVVFWHLSDQTEPLWNKWTKIKKHVPDNTGQYEQNIFLHLMGEPEFLSMNVQKLPCEKYNCYKPEWLKHDPYIIHFKGKEGRDKSKEGPNKNLLEYITGK